MAQVLYERNHLEEALGHIMEGISLSRQLVSTQALAIGLITLGWIQQALGDAVGARKAMDDANQITQNLEIVSLHNPVPAERARLYLTQGDIEEAARWMEGRTLNEGEEPSYARELEYLMLARSLLNRKPSDRALTLLERLEASAKAQARVGSLIEIRVLKALGFQTAGRPDQAMRALAQALLQAESEGYIRTFVDEGPDMAALLHRAALRGVTPD